MKKRTMGKTESGNLYHSVRWGLRLLLFAVWLGLPEVLAAQQTVSFRMEKAPLKQALQLLKEKSGVNFVYNTQDVDDRTVISVVVENKSVEEALDMLLASTPYMYEQVRGYFLIKKKNTPTVDTKTVRGIVRDEHGQPMPGVNVRIDGTNVGQSTNEKGEFVMVGMIEGTTLVFSFIGYEEVKQTVGKQTEMEIKLTPATTEMDEVVVTGMFNRRAESFTGSATTVRGDELRRAGNQNLLSSLKNIDPSFILTDNLEQGSNPNQMPEIYLRGRTSIKGEYEGNPNQPLFILDGFETTMEKVYDLNMNLVASVTLLKDAAAKAIYGAKAANGVVVIETIRPQEGRLRVSYTGSVDVSVPDLTSYNLCNASEKLQAEVLAGKYESNRPADQARLTAEYNALYNEIARGVDTYWLSQPLRTGVGQKHSLYIDGGDEAMRYSANISYNRINGAMKGSDRRTISGVVTLSYRYKNLLFRNNLSIDKNKAFNSPYGSFSTYAEMNPYFRLRDEKGAPIKEYGNGTNKIYNPLYNATIGTKDCSGYTTVTENFYGEWNALKNLKVTARVGVTLRNDDSDVFKPASHTDYASVQTGDSNYANRGQYVKASGKSMNVAVDAGVNYSLEKGRHMLFANGTYSLTKSESESYTTTAIGFPSDKLDFITAGNSYVTGKPTGSESTVNTVGFTAAANYSYDDRYLADASWRVSGSSQFGANQRFGYFWSAGLGWNIHKEAFMQQQEVVNLLKIRGSLGYTGSQNFSAYQAIPAYNYITNSNYKGEIGMILAALANEDLKWQQQYDRNVGFDLMLFNRLSLRADFYSNITKDLLTDITVVPSTGFGTYKDNLGETLNKGWQIGASYRIYSRNDAYVNVNANLLHNSNKVRKIADYLKAYNAAIDAEKDVITSMASGHSDELLKMQRDPSTRYEEGQSLSTIWAVRSMGIDPVTGQEIFLKRDGKSTTTTWSAADQVVCGDTEPKVNGNFGISAGWKGLAVSLAFTFKIGGQMYNSTLVNKIENVDIRNKNVDLRALTERWNTPGIETRFKSIADESTTKSTSRFVEDLNELVLSAVNVTYDLNRVIRKMPFENVRFTFNMSDIGRLSTMRQERGTSYPFARAFSVGLTADF